MGKNGQTEVMRNTEVERLTANYLFSKEIATWRCLIHPKENYNVCLSLPSYLILDVIFDDAPPTPTAGNS